MRALVDDDWDVVSDRRPIFLFITGRGKSQAGVVSVREVLVSGIKRGSALFHLEEAKRCWFSVACLNLNALGENHFHGRGGTVPDGALPAGGNAPIYVLAHLVASGYLVWYLVLGATCGRILLNLWAVAFWTQPTDFLGPGRIRRFSPSSSRHVASTLETTRRENLWTGWGDQAR